MAMQTDIKSSHTTGNGVLVVGRCRVRGWISLGSGVAGDVVLYDNATTNAGIELCRFALQGNATNTVTLPLPAEGMLAYNGVYAVVPTTASLTIFYS